MTTHTAPAARLTNLDAPATTFAEKRAVIALIDAVLAAAGTGLTRGDVNTVVAYARSGHTWTVERIAETLSPGYAQTFDIAVRDHARAVRDAVLAHDAGA